MWRNARTFAHLYGSGGRFMVSAYEKRSVCLYRTWYGRCDRVDYTGEYKDRDWVWHLEPGELFDASYTIEIAGA